MGGGGGGGDSESDLVWHFKEGSVVEVTKENQNHASNGDCSWFLATIIDLPATATTPTPPDGSNEKKMKRISSKKKDLFLVKYHTLFAPGSKPMKEYVHPSRIRPLPPPYPLLESTAEDSCFELNGLVVDAFYDNGWRTGVIIRAAIDQSSSVVSVLFRDLEEEVEFEPQSLRVHQDWVNGKWVLAEEKGTEQQEVPISTAEKLTESVQFTALDVNAKELLVPAVTGLKSNMMNGAEATNDSCQQPNVESLKGTKPQKVSISTDEEMAERVQFTASGTNDNANEFLVPDVMCLKSNTMNGAEATNDSSEHSNVESLKEIKHPRVGVKTLKKRMGRPHKFERLNVPAELSNGSGSDQVNETCESQEGTTRQSLGFDVLGEKALVENQNLPFLKSLPVWKTFESMNVFQKLPQNPNFLSSDSCKEEFREVFAVGCMATFADLVERTFNLQFDEPRSTIESSLKTFDDLEKHGFNVEVVRGQLKKKLLHKEMERQLVEHAREKSKHEEAINEFQKTITDLEEKRAVLISMRESLEPKIARGVLIVDKINERSRSLKHEFEKLAASPLF